MSHEDHKPAGAVTALEAIGPEFGDRTIKQCIEKVLRNHISGGGNALEANFAFTSNVGEFSVHFHLCVHPSGQAAGAGHVKH